VRIDRAWHRRKVIVVARITHAGINFVQCDVFESEEQRY